MASAIFSITFKHDGDFVAANVAEAFLESIGFSVGTQQRGAPRGILYDLYDIQKWRNLSDADRSQLHGAIVTPHNGPAHIEFYDTLPVNPIDPFASFLATQDYGASVAISTIRTATRDMTAEEISHA